MTSQVKYGLIEGPVFERNDDRGQFVEFVNTGVWESAVFAQMNADAVLGGHAHQQTIELVYILEGEARIVTVDAQTQLQSEYVLSPLKGFVFKPEDKKRITFTKNSRIILLKSHRYDPANPDKVVKK